eukprot:3554865-Prymnesium_polylepis.1
MNRTGRTSTSRSARCQPCGVLRSDRSRDPDGDRLDVLVALGVDAAASAAIGSVGAFDKRRPPAHGALAGVLDTARAVGAARWNAAAPHPTISSSSRSSSL